MMKRLALLGMQGGLSHSSPRALPKHCSVYFYEVRRLYISRLYQIINKILEVQGAQDTCSDVKMTGLKLVFYKIGISVTGVQPSMTHTRLPQHLKVS